MIFELIGSLGRGISNGGVLWIVIDPSGAPSKPSRVGSLQNLSWPVIGADGSSIVALQAGRVVRLDANGNVVRCSYGGARLAKAFG